MRSSAKRRPESQNLTGAAVEKKITAPNPRDVARWMVERLRESGFLYPERAAVDIERAFGKEFVRFNENGNLAIGRQVLREFHRMTSNTAVWEKAESVWRWREAHDPPGRQV